MGEEHARWKGRLTVMEALLRGDRERDGKESFEEPPTNPLVHQILVTRVFTDDGGNVIIHSWIDLTYR